MKIIYKIKKLFIVLRALLVLPGINWNDECFTKDLKRWKEIHSIEDKDWIAFAILMWQLPEFRNLYIYRNRFKRIYRYWIAIWYRPMNTLFIVSKEIGGGLYIHHGFSTMIAAETIGENCWINQQVTIGFNGTGRAPIIGNNVMVTCGAKVLGSITIGNNVVVGANAVVIHDVEEGTVVGGIPARRLK